MLVEVVSACIVRNGRVFFTQRRPEASYSFTWESPGGKVEPGENHFLALRRELNEELDWRAPIFNVLDIKVENTPFFEAEFERSNIREDRRHIKLFFYH